MAVEGGGGGTLSELYQNSKRLMLKTRDGLERLERLEFSSSSGVDSPELSFAVKRDIAQIQSLCVEMDRLWRSVAAKSQRDLWKRKVEQVAEEADSLKESLDKYFSRNQRRIQEAREREELLGRANGESSHVLRIFDEEAQAMQSARNSARMLEESHATGVAILAQYHAQRDRLKINDSMGSNTVIGIISASLLRNTCQNMARLAYVLLCWSNIALGQHIIATLCFMHESKLHFFWAYTGQT